MPKKMYKKYEKIRQNTTIYLTEHLLKMYNNKDYKVAYKALCFSKNAIVAQLDRAVPS